MRLKINNYQENKKEPMTLNRRAQEIVKMMSVRIILKLAKFYDRVD